MALRTVKTKSGAASSQLAYAASVAQLMAESSLCVEPRLPSGEIPTPSEQMSLAAVMLISMTLRLLLILVPVWVVFRVRSRSPQPRLLLPCSASTESVFVDRSSHAVCNRW